MRCDDVIINMPDYILGMVEPNLRKCMGEHVDICAKCKSEFESMQESIKVLDKVGHEEYPDSFWQELRAMIMERVTSVRPMRWRVPALAGGFAVLLLMVGIEIYEYTSTHAYTANGSVETVTALASTLPPSEVAELPNLNVNYIDAAVPQIAEADEMNVIDDSTQQAVVKSMWAISISDSAVAAAYYDYPVQADPSGTNIISN